MWVKICCIKSVEEASVAISLGASAIGLVSEMPSGPGVIAESLIAEIAASISAPADTFLLTSEVRADRIVRQHQRCGTNTIQLCAPVADSELEVLRRDLPGVRLVQVIHVKSAESVDEAIAAARRVDAILLDSGGIAGSVEQLGGTGRTHNWQISREIRDAIQVPLYLAGGLNRDNVAEAIRVVEPSGIDLCSSVRTGDHLDPDKLADFFKATFIDAPEE